MFCSIWIVLPKVTHHTIAKHDRRNNNIIFEMKALIERFLLHKTIGITILEIEGDSQIVINTLIKCSTPNW